MNKYVRFFIPMLMLLSFEATAQDVIISGKPGDRPLVWSDFTGTPVDHDQYLAFTNWRIDYEYTGIGLDDDSVSIQGLKVTLKLNNDKSWVKEGKATDELLKHEQGHFDLGRLCQLEILAYIKTTLFDKYEYKTQLKDIFRKSFEKYRVMGGKYDEETNHSINREKQEIWNNFLQNEKTALLEASK